MIFLLGAMTLYCIGSVGIIWLICNVAGWPFNVPMAVGVWMVANFIIGLLRKGDKRDRK